MFNSKAIKIYFIAIAYKLSSELVYLYSSRFITNVPSFILGKLFLEETPLNWVDFDNTFVFQNLLKAEVALKILFKRLIVFMISFISSKHFF